MQKRTKYLAKKTTVDNITFDSMREAQYYAELKRQKESGLIKEFKIQPRYTVLEAYRHPTTRKMVRKVEYVADFLITLPDGSERVTDVKSKITAKNPVYRLKKKLFESRYQIPIHEVLT